MINQNTDENDKIQLALLALESKIAEAQRTLLELERKYELLREAAMIADAITDDMHEKASAVPSVAKGKYHGHSMLAAITDIMQSQPEKLFTAREIYKLLVAGGKPSESGDMLQNIRVFLNKSEKRGHFISDRSGKFIGYNLPRRNV